MFFIKKLLFMAGLLVQSVIIASSVSPDTELAVVVIEEMDAAASVEPIVLDSYFPEIKLALAPWFRGHIAVLKQLGLSHLCVPKIKAFNDACQVSYDQVYGYVAAGKKRAGSLLRGAMLTATQRHLATRLEGLAEAFSNVHNPLIAAGFVLSYESDYRPEVLSSSYSVYKLTSVLAKIRALEDAAAPVDFEEEFDTPATNVAPKLFMSFSGINPMPAKFIGSTSWVTARLLGLPHNMCVLDKKAAAALAAWQVGQLTPDEIERRIDLIIAGEELRLPESAEALLRELMRTEYAIYRTKLREVGEVFAR